MQLIAFLPLPTPLLFLVPLGHIFLIQPSVSILLLSSKCPKLLLPLLNLP